MLAEDGSGKGAGLVSAIAQRINARNANIDAVSNGNGQQCYPAKVANGKATLSKCNGRATTSMNGHQNSHSNGHSK